MRRVPRSVRAGRAESVARRAPPRQIHRVARASAETRAAMAESLVWTIEASIRRDLAQA
jgi:hypothetical protein